MTRPYHRRPASDVTGRHRAWLELVDRDGPFLAVPALKRAWPQGIGHVSDTAKAALADAKPDFDRAWDECNRAVGAADDETALAQYRGARDKWVQTVLQDVAGWGNLLTWDLEALPNPVGPAGVPVARSQARRVEVRASGALRRGNDVGALVFVVDPVNSLRDPGADEWSASPIDRMDALLRSTGHHIGIVTDGRWWAIVSAQPEVMTASGVVDAQTWVEEADVRNAFFALLDVQRFFGGETAHRIAALFRESVTAAEEITVALGTQVRRAVELVVTAFSESAADARAAGRPDPLPAERDQVYDGAVTAMMRVVFLLFAEERSMMPQSVLFTSAYGVSDELDRLDSRLNEEGAEALDATHHTWHRLLATSRALYSGVNTEDMRLPAYGGSLFDAERFEWLTATDVSGALTVTVSDRVMLEVLRSVQYAPIGGESRRISFRDIGVEQIGYIYEGLLGYTSLEVDEVTVGLIGKDGEEPEVPLDTLDDLWEEFDGDPKADENAVKALADWVKKNQPAATLQPKSASGLVRKLNVQAEDAERALLSVTRDKELIARLRPYLGLVRRDLRDRPVVIQPGGLSVVETKSRANAGAHYTPKSLAQEVVLHALEPLVYSPGPHQSADRETWRAIDSNQILDLKIADIACGSGAFLVAAAEYLADRLVEAWHREGIESLTSHELLLKARRAVVASCLYGADINAMAVEMCKLSLWLVSLDPGQPFSFVDDKVLHGNSLLGLTDVKQIEEVHIDPGRVKHQHSGSLLGVGGDVGFVETVDVRAKVRALANLRRQIAGEIVENDVMRSANAKKRLWTRYQTDAAELTHVADGVIAAGLALGGKQGKALDEKYRSLRIAVDRTFAPGGDLAMLDAIVEHGLTPTVETDYERWKPLHWVLAVPDVFENGGFDAIVGNPPFLGGQKLTGAMGTNVRDWFVNVLAAGRRGSADLVAYFFLRATSLLQTKGTLGLIATNTVAQGDTREVGLDAMVADVFTITRAVQSRPWPAQSANLEYAAVWGTCGPVSANVPRVADDIEVRRIGTLLEPAGRAEGNPIRLAENARIAFQGCIVRGMGFVLEPHQAQRWITEDARNAEVLFPYLNGEDLNQRPDASAARWVVDFMDRSESDAATYQIPFERVRQLVKPERESNKDRLVREHPWWRFWRTSPAMRKAISGLPEVLVIALVSKTVMPVRVPSGQVFSNTLGVFATDSYSDQAVLSSSLHQMWAITYGSGMRNDPRYTPSDVFETFPFPVEHNAKLDEIGRMLDAERREIMLRMSLGLTKLYNRINDPADLGDNGIERIREMHAELDRVTMAAYGWEDVPLHHDFHTVRHMKRWTISPAARVEILDRLLGDNHRRTQE